MIQTTATPKLFIGIDIHKKSWKVHFRTDLFTGRSMTMPPKPEILRQHVLKHFPEYEVITAYEAGCCGYSGHRAFESYGWKSLVVNAADIPKPQKQSSQKTDKIDARNISRQLRDGQLRGIYIPNKEQEQLRSLFRRRNELTKDLRRIKSKIKAQLLYYGIELPKEYDNSYWAKDMIIWIEQQVWEYPTGLATMQSRIANYHFIESEVRAVSVKIRAYCRKHYKADYNLMRSVPGIGPIVAAGILSELGDIRRFNKKQFVGYIGLVPGIYQSGDKLVTKGKFGEISLNLLMLNEVLRQNNHNIENATYGKACKCCVYIIARAFKILLLIQKMHEDLHLEFKASLKELGLLIGDNHYLMKTAIHHGLDVNWLISFDIPEGIEEIHKELRTNGYLK